MYILGVPLGEVVTKKIGVLGVFMLVFLVKNR
jgi:hypothetical protein